MSWAPLLLLLSTLCACSSAQLVVTQPPSVSVTPGGTATLPCSISGGNAIGGYYMRWLQQKPGSPPRYLLFYYSSSSNNLGSGVPARFSASKDTSRNIGYLTITGVLAEDNADYYCNMEYGGTYMYIFGGGTQLNVLTGETKLPALNVFPPSSEEVATGKATLVCTMHDFYPGSVTVTWKADGTPISSGVETTRPSKQSDNNLFMASSILSVPAVDWSGGRKYTCECTHQSKIIEKSVKHSECV